MSKTFMITGVWGRKPHLYIRSFDLFGETWVIHTRRDGPGYRCSHKSTGQALRDSDADTIGGSLCKAREKLEALGEAAVIGMLLTAREGEK